MTFARLSTGCQSLPSASGAIKCTFAFVVAVSLEIGAEEELAATETWQAPRGEGGLHAHLGPSDSKFLPKFLPCRFLDFSFLTLFLEGKKKQKQPDFWAASFYFPLLRQVPRSTGAPWSCTQAPAGERSCQLTGDSPPGLASCPLRCSQPSL